MCVKLHEIHYHFEKFYYLNLKQILFQRRKTLKHNLTLRKHVQWAVLHVLVISSPGLPAIMNRDKREHLHFLWKYNRV